MLACSFFCAAAIATSTYADDSLHSEKHPDQAYTNLKKTQADELGFIVSADFIYWTVRQDGQFYSVSGVGTNTNKGSVHELDWRWQPGFKVALGLNLPHDDWDLLAEYTWIYSKASGRTQQDAATSTLTSYWAVNGAVAFLQNARASWGNHFNNIDLELGKNTQLSPYFNLRLHAGLKGSWINQNYNVRYTTITGDLQHLKQDHDFWGVGPRAGIDTTWYFVKHFSFFGDLAVSLLWSQFNLDRKETVTTAGVFTVVFNTGVSPHTFEPVIELFAGFRWDTGLGDNDKYHCTIEAGWENQIWILQNQYIKRMPETDHAGNLVLQGLTVKAKFEF